MPHVNQWLIDLFVISYLMPKGVEHTRFQTFLLALILVISYLMPKGVEHLGSESS